MKLLKLVTPLLSLDAKFVSEKNVKIRQNSTFSHFESRSNFTC